MPEQLYHDMSQTTHKIALRLYRAQNSVWLAIAVSSIVSAVAWGIDPTDAAKSSAIGKEFRGPWDDFWNYSMGVGGVFVFAGIWWYRVRIEILGHFLLGGGLGVYCLAIIMANKSATPALFLTGGLSLAAGVTILLRWRTTPKKADQDAG